MDQWDARMTRRPDPEPRRDLVETAWRFTAPSGRTLSCSIFRTDVGLEIRVGYSEEDLLYSKRAVDNEHAREIAAELREAVVVKGGFTEVTSGLPQ
jgi:hypothetical protein